MNLSQGQAVSPMGGESGAGAGLGTGANAGPAHPGYQVGAVGFGPQWTMEDSMAASIIRLEQENEELRAEVALLREEQSILKGDGLRIAVEATSWARVAKERDQWRECAEKLHAAVCYFAPQILSEDGLTEEKEAVREFMRLKEGE